MTAILKLILTKLWPILIPLLLYVMWLFYCKYIRKDKKVDIFAPPFGWVIASMAVIAVLMMAWISIEQQKSEESYVPTRVEGGKIVPSQTEKKP
jgi:quinol-cytochrome oxidoreductase complex cytochrome b subunit